MAKRALVAAAVVFGTWVALGASVAVRDIDGREVNPLAPIGAASVLFFVTHDCPIANSYAPEIQRICADYRSKGVACSLVYVDPTLDAPGVRKHITEYRYHADVTPILDRTHNLVDATHATITPEAVVVAHDGAIVYRGRIDNFYAGLGKPRRQATQRDLRIALDEVLAGKPVSHAEVQPVGCYIPALSAYLDHN
jgi:hypothetical protein